VRVLVNAVNLRSAGTAVTGRELLAALSRAGGEHELLFVVPAGYGFEEVPTRPGAAVEAVRLPRLWPLWRLWFDFVGLARRARRFRADVVLAINNHAPVTGGVPKVVLCRSVFYRTAPGLGADDRPLRMALERWLFGFTVRSADLMVAQTRGVAEALERIWRVPRTRLRVIPNALNTAVREGAEDPGGERARLPPPYPEHAFVLLYPSRYYPYKNHRLLLDAAGILRQRDRRDVVFVTTVDPALAEARPFLERLRDEPAGDRVLNLGEVPQRELNAWYRRADALVFPSLAETFGNALLEGMAWGLPLLVADRPYAEDVCQDAALLFPPDDPAALADLCERLADEPGLRSEMSARSRSRSEAFPTWDEVAAGFLALAEGVAGRGHEARPAAPPGDPREGGQG
jgi:glycosyltransferase involved in cell wall biosynthesis